MREIIPPGKDITSPESKISPTSNKDYSLEGDLTDPNYVYRLVRADVVKLVMSLQTEMKTKEASIQWISKHYKLRSFVRKLWNGERAKVEVWQWVTIRKALSRQLKLQKLRSEHHEMFSNQLQEYGL